MKTVSGPLVALCLGIVVLALCACVVAFIPGFGGAPTPGSFVSIRGESVRLMGTGLYRLDSVSFATQAQAQDLVTLAIGIPALLLSCYFALRGSLRSGLLLAGTLGYFAYTYATYAFGVQYNRLFLVYVALLSMSVAALILSLFRLSPDDISTRFTGRGVRRAAIGFDFFVGVMLLLMWISRIGSGLLGGPDQTMIEHYTTLPIQVMDLAFVVPLALTAGYQLLRDRALGYLLTGLLLTKGLTLGLALGAMIVWMAVSGLPVNIGETLVFSAIILGGLTISGLFLRAIRQESLPYQKI